MKILLIANYLPDGQQSIRRFETMLSKGLTALGHEVRVIRPGKILGFGKWLGYLDKLIFFIPVLLRQKKWADIIHVLDHSNAIYAHFLQGAPHVVTCNDLLAVCSARGEFKQNPTRWTGKVFQAMILSGLKKARNIVCISEKTKADFLRLTGKNPARVPVIPMAADPVYFREVAEPPDKPFFLHVGGNQWYKNRRGVVEIFERLKRDALFSDFELVMAGKGFDGALHDLIKSKDLASQVVERTGPSDEVLRTLYSTASALIFPSFAEGFGWPIVEAQACGCPVFASDRAPMTEAGGEGAIYFDPDKPLEAAQVIKAGLADVPAMQKAGLKNARKFSAQAMILGYLEVYKEIVGDKQ